MMSAVKTKPTVIIISGKHPIFVKSGYAGYAQALACELKTLGFSVRIFCVGEKSSVTKTPIGTIQVVKVPLIHLVSGREMVGLLPFAVFLSRAISKFIDSNSNVLLWGIGPWTLAGAFTKYERPQIKLFADYFTTLKHEYALLPLSLETILAKNILMPFYTLLERYLLSHSNRIITHYRSTENILRRQFKSDFNFFRLPVLISQNSTKFSLSKPKPKQVPLILTICRQDYRKNIPGLLNAYVILNKKGLKFSAVIAGGGAELEKNRQFARELNLSNVKFPGFVSNLNKIILKADIFVLPTLEEGSGALSVLEAMRAGLAVVATNVDGLPEDIVDGKNGLLVPPNDSHHLAGAIGKLLTYPALRAALGKQAQKLFLIKYNEKKTQGLLNKLIKVVSD